MEFNIKCTVKNYEFNLSEIPWLGEVRFSKKRYNYYIETYVDDRTIDKLERIKNIRHSNYVVNNEKINLIVFALQNYIYTGENKIQFMFHVYKYNRFYEGILKSDESIEICKIKYSGRL